MKRKRTEGSDMSVDLASEEKEKEKEKEEPPPPRVKVCIDLAWLSKPLTKMTPLERKLFDLVSALKDCGTDRFLCVRGLFASVSVGTGGEGVPQGFVNADDVMLALKRLSIIHCLSL